MYLEDFLNMSDDAILLRWSGKNYNDLRNWIEEVSQFLSHNDENFEKREKFNTKLNPLLKRIITLECNCGYRTPIGTSRELLINHYFQGHKCPNKTTIPNMPGWNP